MALSEQTKNKIFWVVLILMIVYAVVATYIRVFVQMDYLMKNEVSCDPASESCFVYTAEDACAESTDPDCLSSTEDWIYKYIYKKAANIPFCEYNPELGESCPELMCEPGEPEDECYYEYCEEGCAPIQVETQEGEGELVDDGVVERNQE
jgi:hypothetical protein